jgi:hypothetical protein
MIWFSLLLVIFWKPIYWGVKYFIKRKDPVVATVYTQAIKDWFGIIWGLISPIGAKW